jgi:2-haloacid dehalogenase
MTRPEAVVFDIGNVLIEWQPERWYDAKIGEARRREMFAAVDLHGVNDRIDRGEEFRTVIYEAAETYPAFADEIRMWHDNWIELASPVIPQSVRLMEALQRRGVPVFALTNFGIGTYEVATPVYPFLGRFDRAFISGHLGVTKPDAEIYRIVEHESGLAPGALLFTDDRPENIEAAAKRGWGTHLFDGPQAWADRLVAEGLLSAEDAA